MTNNINYQQIFEEEISEHTKSSANLAERFFELPYEQRCLVESLMDAAYQRAVDDAFNPEVVLETAELAGEMGAQLYNFANMLQTYLSDPDETDWQNYL